jgi:hypothetical protein
VRDVLGDDIDAQRDPVDGLVLAFAPGSEWGEDLPTRFASYPITGTTLRQQMRQR